MEITLSRFHNRNFELLEPYEGKLSCTVLRGEGSRKGADLPGSPPCEKRWILNRIRFQAARAVPGVKVSQEPECLAEQVQEIRPSCL